MRSADRLTRAERAVQKKIVSRQKLTEKDKRVVQRRAVKNLQRRGRALPSGARIVEGGDGPSSGPVIDLMDSMAASMWGQAGSFRGTEADDQVTNAIEGNPAFGGTISFHYAQTRGFNVNWSGTVHLGIGTETVLSSGEGTVTRTAGGSRGSEHRRDQSTTDSAGVSGEASAGGHEGKAGGKVGATGGTSSTSSRGTTTSAGRTGGSSVETEEILERRAAPVIAEVTMRMELDISGSDWINPFKWGMALGEAIEPVQDRTQQTECGIVHFEVSLGFKPREPEPSRGGGGGGGGKKKKS